MKLYEFEAKQVFKDHGIPVPMGRVAKTPNEAREIAQEIGMPVAVKAQVLAGTRGRSGFIRFADNPNEAEKTALELLGSQFSGSKVASLLVEEKLDIGSELYVAVTVDGAARKFVMIVSPEGGIEIEEIAAKFPEKIIKKHVDPWLGLLDFQIRKLIKGMGLRGEQASAVREVLTLLYDAFKEHDGVLAEINPLVITKGGSVVAVDARLSIDENALDRHPEFKAKFEERKSHLEGAELREWDATRRGVGAYVELDGDIAVLANGASLGMETIDLVSDLSGKPACFCDIGAMVTAELVENSMDLVLSNPRVRVLLFNILGGLVRCDLVADGIVNHARRRGALVPMVARLSGTLEEQGRNILRGAGVETFDSIFEAVKRVVEMMKELEK